MVHDKNEPHFWQRKVRGPTSPQILMPFSLPSNIWLTKLKTFLHSLLALDESGEFTDSETMQIYEVSNHEPKVSLDVICPPGLLTK